MSDERSPRHPSPHRDRVPLWRQGFGVYAAPAAWAVQLLVGYSLTAYACHPGPVALTHVAPGWEWTRPASLVNTRSSSNSVGVRCTSSPPRKTR